MIRTPRRHAPHPPKPPSAARRLAHLPVLAFLFLVGLYLGLLAPLSPLSPLSQPTFSRVAPPAPAPRLPTPPQCRHTCLKVLPNTCLNGRGEVAYPARHRPVLPATALVYALYGHTNPEHAIHEDGFPLFYHLQNCYDPSSTDLYVYSAHDSLYTHFFKDTVRWWASDVRAQENAPDSTVVRVQATKRDEDFPTRCYEAVHVVLNPLRTPCTEDPGFHERDDALEVQRFVGKHGLGMRVNVLVGNDVVSVGDAPRQAAFEVMRRYLAARFGFAYPPFSTEVAFNNQEEVDRPLVVTIITRGENVTKRRQTNGQDMQRAVQKKFGRAVAVNLVEMSSDMALDRQLEMFHQADVVVAVHGGALGNCFSMRPGSLMVTQCSRLKCDQWENTLAPLLGVTVEKFDYRDLNDADDPVVDFAVEPILDLLAKHIKPVL